MRRASWSLLETSPPGPRPWAQVVGGPPKREALLVGLKSGAVVKVFVDNPFPIPLMTHSAGVRCLDASATRRQLAVVDEHSKLAVYDLENKARGPPPWLCAQATAQVCILPVAAQ